MEFSFYLAHLLSIALFVLWVIIKLLITLFGLKNKIFQDKIRVKSRYVDWLFLGAILITGFYLLISTNYFQLYHILKILGLAGLIYFSRYFVRTFYGLSLLLVCAVFGLVVLITISKPKWETQKLTVAEKEEGLGNIMTNALAKGQIVFETICADCHGKDGKLGKFGAIDLTKSKLTIEQKKEVVTNGRALTVMRAFKSEVSPTDIDAVVKYIESLRTHAGDQ